MRWPPKVWGLHVPRIFVRHLKVQVAAVTPITLGLGRVGSLDAGVGIQSAAETKTMS